MGTKALTGEGNFRLAIQFAHWCMAQRYLKDLTTKEAAAKISSTFGVSRATGYRWLAAWREVSVVIPTTRSTDA